VEELQDYSGEFKPDLKMTDFSKEMLVKMWESGGKLSVGMLGCWLAVVREKFGDDVTFELAMEVERRYILIERRRGREAGNFWGDDVADIFKYFQIDPGTGPICDKEFDLKDNNHGIWTVPHCHGLEIAEKIGDTALQSHICEWCRMCLTETFPLCGFNPKLKVTPLKLEPRPRKNRDEICCQWEFKID